MPCDRLMHLHLHHLLQLPTHDNLVSGSSASDGERASLAKKLGVAPEVLYKDMDIPSPAEAATEILRATVMREPDCWYPEEQGMWWLVL